MIGMVPPIAKMDNTLGTLKEAVHLSLGSNAIDKIAGLGGLDNLKSLALSRNGIKALANLDMCPELEELWISYNQLSSLAGIEKAPKLKQLFMSNNQIKDWAEIDRLGMGCPALSDLNLINNPVGSDLEAFDRRVQILKRVPTLSKLDGLPIEQEEIDAARALE